MTLKRGTTWYSLLTLAQLSHYVYRDLLFICRNSNFLHNLNQPETKAPFKSTKATILASLLLRHQRSLSSSLAPPLKRGFSSISDQYIRSDWKYYVRNLEEGSCFKRRRRRSEVIPNKVGGEGRSLMEVKGGMGGTRRRSEEGWEVVDVERGQEEGKWLDKKKGKEKK
ncbi:hypothetical protein LXL04_036605 [Taraxacum kok-saghyz]